jgi:hypothetical protein
MMRRALLVIAVSGSVAHADVSPPPARRGGEALPRSCSLEEWLGIKHAVARFCSRREDDDCQWARENLSMQFCDGERPDPERCTEPLMVRESDERCTLDARAPGGVYRIRVQPDCWSWGLEAVRQKRGWRVTRFGISVSGCD